MTTIEDYLADLKILVPGTRISPLNLDPNILRHKSPLCIKQHFLLEQLRVKFQGTDLFSDGMLVHLHNFTSGMFRLHASSAGRWGLALLDGTRTLSWAEKNKLGSGEWHETSASELTVSLKGEAGASWLCVVFSSNTSAAIDCDCLLENA